jgi:RNA polymerase sigma factor (sigma-70 family)
MVSARATSPIAPAPAAAPSTGLGPLVEAARAGDERAWTALVRRLEPRLRWAVGRYGLSPAQVDDVLQAAWLALLENLGALRSPDAVGAWLVVTVRREAFRVLQGHVREVVVDDPLAGREPAADGLEAQVLAGERRSALAGALRTLPDRHRRLIGLMLLEPDLEYREISARTGIPIGSIGPIRGRCVARLAGDAAVQALRD